MLIFYHTEESHRVITGRINYALTSIRVLEFTPEINLRFFPTVLQTGRKHLFADGRYLSSLNLMHVAPY